MKRVIDGVTYNTDTSTMIARAEEDQEFNSYTNEPAKSIEVALYQTRGGAFFLHTYTETSRQNAEGEWRDIVRNEFDAMTASEARHWITNSRHQVEILNDVFGEPPEAAAEEKPGATVYYRLPAALKEQMEKLAEAEGLSVNSWLLRCTESCVAQKRNVSSGIAPPDNTTPGSWGGIVSPDGTIPGSSSRGE